MQWPDGLRLDWEEHSSGVCLYQVSPAAAATSWVATAQTSIWIWHLCLTDGIIKICGIDKYLHKANGHQASQQSLACQRQITPPVGQPSGSNRCQCRKGQHAVVKLHGSCVLEDITPAFDCAVFLRHKSTSHQGECVVRMPSIQPSNKSTCIANKENAVKAWHG